MTTEFTLLGPPPLTFDPAAFQLDAASLELHPLSLVLYLSLLFPRLLAIDFLPDSDALIEKVLPVRQGRGVGGGYSRQDRDRGGRPKECNNQPALIHRGLLPGWLEEDR